jgi:hypothetical protein
VVARNESPDPWRDLKGRWFLIHSRAGQYFKSFPVPFAGVVPNPPDASGVSTQRGDLATPISITD